MNRKRLSPTKLLLFLLLLVFNSPALAYYDPGVQRWINRDPIGEMGGLDLFLIVQNNPINIVDSFGLLPPGGLPPGEASIPNAVGTYRDLCSCSDHLHRVFGDAEATAEGLTGTRHVDEGSSADALTHCIGACVAARNPGPCGTAEAVSYWINEYRGDTGTSPYPAANMDYLNNRAGAIMSRRSGSCASNCLQALMRGILFTIRGGDAQPFPPIQRLN